MFVLNDCLPQLILSYLLPNMEVTDCQAQGLFRLKIYPWAMPSGRLGERQNFLCFQGMVVKTCRKNNSVI